jgi:hypothetical protein
LQLSSIIRQHIGSGQQSPDSDDESIAARTAGSLSHFAGLLRQYSVQTRGIEKTRLDGLFAF